MKKDKIKILTVLPILGQPRDSKRISMLQEMNFNVKVTCFERTYHKGRLPNCNILSLGKITHGNYLKRIFKLIKALPKLRNAMKHCDIIYSSGSDMAYLSLLAGINLNKPIVLEIGDIREIQVKKGVFGKIIRLIDKYCIKKCSLLVLTSSDFYNQYYKKWLNIRMPHIILENKIEDNIVQPNEIIKYKDKEKIKIGYFGLLRCEWTWNVLKEISNTNKFEILVAGYPMKPINILVQIQEFENITYFGEYKSPNDLEKLYGNVDIVWATYPYTGEDDWNLKWARTNRFYESCFYRKPIISQQGSNDGKQVNFYNIGLVLREYKVENVINELIKNITPKSLYSWKKNINSLDKNIYIYSKSEIDNLEKQVTSLYNSSKT